MTDTLTREQLLTALARDVHNARPEWGIKGILDTLTALADDGHAYTPVRAAALHAAKDTRYKTPQGIRWRLEDDTITAASDVPDTGPCGICGKSRLKCETQRPLVTKGEHYDDHVYEPPAARGHRTNAATRRG